MDPNHFVIGLTDFTQSWGGGAKIGTIVPYPIQTILGNEINCGGVSPVPILVNSINQITHFSLFMEYDTSKLSYLSYQNLNSQLIDDSLSITDDNGIINIQYNSNIPINISSDTLLDILFDMDISQSGDVNHLTWNDTISLYINNFGDTIASHFTNGTLSAIEPIGIVGPISGNDSVCIGTESETYTISSIDNSLSYTWDFEPDSAGLVEANDTIAIISFLPGFVGDASLSVFGTSICGNSDTSFMNISVIMTPTAIAGSDTSICENSSCSLSGMAYNYHHVYWATFGDGSFDDPFLLNSTYFPGNEDIANGSVSLILFAFANNPCLGEVGDTLNLTITPLPVVDSGSDDSTCIDDPYLLDGTAYNYSTIKWTTCGDGDFNDTTQLMTYYYPGPYDIELGSVNIVLTASANYPCNELISDTVVLSIIDIPYQPSTPLGPVVILLDTCSITEYYTDTVENANSYQWYLDPSDAGVITGNGINAIVNWNTSYIGIVAYIYVQTINNCGEAYSDSLIIDISPVGLFNENFAFDITVSPNPSNGIYNVTIKGLEGYAELYVSNTSGKLIRYETLNITKNEYKYSLDLSGVPSGVYYMRIVLKKQKHFDNMIILRKD